MNPNVGLEFSKEFQIFQKCWENIQKMGKPIRIPKIYFREFLELVKCPKYL
jgi:hypothetical protein